MLLARCLILIPVSLFLPDESLAPGDEWNARLADVARVETSATAEWEPARPGMLGDTEVSRDEVQAFLFMNNGSRRVIASVHAGREDMAKLTHSIRTWIDEQRRTERVTGETRKQIAALETADGFNI